MNEINPALRQRVEEQRRARLESTPSGRYRPELDPARPASAQPGANNLALFWIAWFVVVALLSWYFGSGL